MKEKIFINKTGGCICGDITFNVKLDEVPLVFNCHCIDCRKKIGGMMTIILLRDGAIDIDKSKLKIYEHEGGSGNKIKKHFMFHITVYLFFNYGCFEHEYQNNSVHCNCRRNRVSCPSHLHMMSILSLVVL